ncbi:hypothetical protein EJB05_34725 [Eragrostis curvula]|uniref:Uncharacterized protein n=1 Tax=Eragrostis curvula TaxID=38414 RepID=A0A5J9U5R7_9POAL|nr:hypothetical protein EJB05_34725 [Eragrostis curvula]
MLLNIKPEELHFDTCKCGPEAGPDVRCSILRKFCLWTGFLPMPKGTPPPQKPVLEHSHGHQQRHWANRPDDRFGPSSNLYFAESQMGWLSAKSALPTGVCHVLTLGKDFDECKQCFAECLRHWANYLFPGYELGSGGRQLTAKVGGHGVKNGNEWSRCLRRVAVGTEL